MANIPASEKNQIAFRSPTSSEAQNKQASDVFFDITNLYNMVNNFDKNLEDTKDIFTVENKFQQLRIKELQHNVSVLVDELNKVKLDVDSHLVRDYAEDMAINKQDLPFEQANIDTFRGIVTLPIAKQVSKLYVLDENTGTIIVPDTLKVQVIPAADGISTIDNNVMNAFSGQSSSFWVRKVVVPEDSSTDYVEAVVHITLPDNIISNREINTITIHPFPLNTIDITKMEFSLDGISWNDVPGFVPVEQANNLKFCFESREMAQLRITMKQTRPIVENAQKTFYLGASEIGVYYTGYGAIGKFDIPIVMNATDKDGNNYTSREITSIVPKFRNEQALTDTSVDKRSVFNYTIYTAHESGGVESLQHAKDTLPILVTSQKIVLKATLNADPNNQVTPALESVEVAYIGHA